MYMANIVMPDAQRKILAVATDPACSKSLDIMFFDVNQESARQSLACLGENGRKAYRTEKKVEDSIYPIVYTIFFLYTLFALGSYLFPRRKRWLLLLILPLIGMGLDFYENSSIITLIDQFPNLAPGSVWRVSWVGSLKWMVVFVNVAVTLVLAGMALTRYLRKRRSN
jgi:hypothetical protein